MSRAGERGAVVYEQTETLKYRMMLDDAEATVDSAEVAILDRDGSTIVTRTSTGVSVSGSVVTYSRSWSSSLFQREDGYRAVLYITVSAVEYTRNLYFDVIKRAFHSQLCDTDITDSNPYVTAPKGQTDLSTYRREAWRIISDKLRKRLGTHPGNIFYPEEFFTAHKFLTESRYYFAVAFKGGNSEDWDKYEALKSEGMKEIEQVVSSLAVDEYPEDGKVSAHEKKRNYSGVRLVR